MCLPTFGCLESRGLAGLTLPLLGHSCLIERGIWICSHALAFNAAQTLALFLSVSLLSGACRLLHCS